MTKELEEGLKRLSPVGQVSARTNEAPKKAASPKKESRGKRWARLAAEACSAIEALKDVQSEFEEWRDNMPEGLQSSPVYEKLETICDIDLQGALDTLDEAQNADVPLGFGRD